MYCQKCGAENLENAAICQQCGGVFVYSKPTRTSGMAITSMILGISGYPMFGVFIATLTLGLVFGMLALVTWILSLVFGTLALIIWLIGLVVGMMALGRVGKSGGQIKGKGLAITGVSASASGLAFLLTVVGVLVFLNSAITMSLHKKIETQNGFTQAAKADERPQINGWINIISDPIMPESNCVGTLFAPEQQNFPNITTNMTCETEGQTPVKVSWQFAGHKKDADVYNFTLTVPLGQNSSSTIKKTILYDGTEQVIFEDARRKIYIRPEK